MLVDCLSMVLYTGRFDKEKHFFGNILSLPTIAQSEAEHIFCAGKTGRIRLVNKTPASAYMPTALWIEAGHVDAAYARMRKHDGVRYLVPLCDRYYGAREFQVLDPDGNIVCVINYQKDIADGKRSASQDSLYADEFRGVLYVKNLDACYRFYTGVMGLDCVYSWHETIGDRGFKYALCPNSNSYIETLFREPLSPLKQGILELFSYDFDQCHHEMENRLGLRIPLCADRGQKPRIKVCDPDGNLVYIIQA